MPSAADSARLLERLRGARLRLALAESCTGGMVAAALTDIAGSSDVVERGFVTYSNEAKAELLGVPMKLIREQGAVSERVAVAMAEGALARSHADLAVAVTGIAGPGGATADKPVGLVHLACARRGRTTHGNTPGETPSTPGAATRVMAALTRRPRPGLIPTA